MSLFGSHITIFGIYVIAKSSSIMTPIIGISSRMTPLIFALPKPDTINSNIPKGGVESPIIIFKQITTPKWTKSMPNAFTRGITIGTKTN